MTSLNVLCFRFSPGQDLKREIESIVRLNNIRAGWVMTCVGSLTQAHLRYANQPTGTLTHGYFEIVSLVGTLSPDGVHLHMCVADGAGNTSGGHLLDQNLVYTTVELIVGVTKSHTFSREQDPSTGYKELVVKHLSGR